MAGDLFTLTPDELMVTRSLKKILRNIATGKNLIQLLQEKEAALPHLTKTEQKKLQKLLPPIRDEIRNLDIEKNEKTLAFYTKTLPIHTIATLSHNCEEFEIFCEKKEFEAHWKRLIPEQNVLTQPKLSWRAQDNNNPKFKQLLSIFWFIAALQEDDKPLAIRYRQKSAELGCFLGQYAEIQDKLQQFYADIDNKTLEYCIVELAHSTAQLHRLHGYILLATVYISIASVYQNRVSQLSFFDMEIAKKTANQYCEYASACLDYAQNSPPETVSFFVDIPSDRFFTASFYARSKCSTIEEIRNTLNITQQQIPSPSSAPSSISA